MKMNCDCGDHTRQGAEITPLTSRLRREFRKITGPRAAILEILRHHRHPLASKEIHAEMPAGECDLATVYRAVRMLENLGMVKRFDFGDGVARFELLFEGEEPHFHHLICTQCAGVVKITDCFPEEIEHRIATRNGFQAVTHRLQFFGICPRCQK